MPELPTARDRQKARGLEGKRSATQGGNPEVQKQSRNPKGSCDCNEYCLLLIRICFPNSFYNPALLPVIENKEARTRTPSSADLVGPIRLLEYVHIPPCIDYD